MSLEILFSLPTQKQDKIHFLGRKAYHRGSLTTGISFADGILVLTGALYYPASPYELEWNAAYYPLNVTIEALKGKYGDDWLEFYQFPRKSRYDILGEFPFTSLSDCEGCLERLSNTFESRCVAPGWERDFAARVGRTMTVEGDRQFLLTLANSLRVEDRVEIADNAKRVLSKDEGALLALGCCFASLERSSFDGYDSRRDGREMSFAESYSW